MLDLIGNQDIMTQNFSLIDDYLLSTKTLNYALCPSPTTMDIVHEIPQSRIEEIPYHDIKQEPSDLGETFSDYALSFDIDPELTSKSNTASTLEKLITNTDVNSLSLSTPVTCEPFNFNIKSEASTLDSLLYSQSSTLSSAESTSLSSSSQFPVLSDRLSAQPSQSFLTSRDATPHHLDDCTSSSSVSQTTSFTDLIYTDLDNTSSSYDFLCENNSKQTDGVGSLESAVVYMHCLIHKECQDLNVPLDPEQWTHEQTRIWTSWVCSKYNVEDISRNIYPMDGKLLCGLPDSLLISQLGKAGRAVVSELGLLKAANKCGFQEPSFMNEISMTDLPCLDQMTPSVSPSPSSSSGSANTDDEISSGSSILSMSNPMMYKRRGRGHKHTTHLWQFLRELLYSGEKYTDCIRWLDRKQGIFKIEDSKKVATLWGERKNRPAMNYDKLSRSVRQYYKKGIIKKTEQSKRLVYQFCPGYM